jgi:hypothetical protein
MQQFRSTRSTSSTLIDQYTNDCRSIGESLQMNVQRITEDIRTILSTCNRSVGKDIKEYESFFRKAKVCLQNRIKLNSLS